VNKGPARRQKKLRSRFTTIFFFFCPFFYKKGWHGDRGNISSSMTTLVFYFWLFFLKKKAGKETEKTQKLINEKRKLALEVQSLKEEKAKAQILKSLLFRGFSFIFWFSYEVQ
jgi:hypothetical protein